MQRFGALRAPNAQRFALLGSGTTATVVPNTPRIQAAPMHVGGRRRPSGTPCGPTPLRAAAVFGSVDEDLGPGGRTRYMLACGLIDYYEVLQVDDDASFEEVKKAYRALAKECHPDYLGDAGHNLCIVLNEAYEVLSDPEERSRYNARLEVALKDDEDSFTGKPLSKWMPTVQPSMAKHEDPAERRAVFVDEFSCIGCKQCVWCASATFRMEPEHGRSRVYAQWLDDETKIQTAIESCPVSCIYWVDRDDLAALEYVTQKKVTQRNNVANMMAGMGSNIDAFSATAAWMKERKRKAEAVERSRNSRPYSPAQEAARRAATEDLRRQKTGWFSNISSFFAAAAMHMQMSVDDDPDLQQVGRRKRAVRWDVMQQAAAASRPLPGYTVPPERALVHIKRDDSTLKRLL